MNIFPLSTSIGRTSAHILAVLLCGGSLGYAQLPSNAGAVVDGDFAITSIGPHSRIWQNSCGQKVEEIATGMNVWDGQQWRPSDPSFLVSPDGTAFVADQIQDPTRLAANLNCVGAVSVLTPDGATLRSTPIAIGLYDAASGKAVIVATVTNSAGVLVDPQHVVYKDAFLGGGFAASVVYSRPDAGSFHQDVVFTGFNRPFDPTVFGFEAASVDTLQIQIVTEFYDNPAQPQTEERQLYIEQDHAVRAKMASPDLIDFSLDFGHYVFGPGRAFTSLNLIKGDPGVKVVKNFVTSFGRTFLVESVPYRWLAGDLQALPAATARNTPPQRLRRARKTMLAAADLPQLREVKKGKEPKIMRGKKLAIVEAKPRGVTVDYVVTVSSLNEPTIFSADTTYFVSGNVTLSSPTVMESAVFKLATNGFIISVNNTLTLTSTNYRPTIFTAADDNTAGTTLSTTIWSNYTGNPTGKYYGYAGLYLETTANLALNNLRFSFMSSAIDFLYASSTQTLALSHSQIVNCDTGIAVVGAGDGGGGNNNDVVGMQPLIGGGGGGGTTYLTLTVNNCLMANVQNPFSASAIILTGVARNGTIDSCSNLLLVATNATGSFMFTNSILSSVGSEGTLGSLTLGGTYNGFYSSPTFGSSYTSLGSNPYQPVGAGNYYQSSLLTNGTTNVGSALLAQLEAKTTQPPLVLTNTFTSNTVLMPVAQRDTSGTALGFHYDPIDFISACAVSNATLLLTNGVAVAYYDNLGVWLQDGSQLISQGAPNYRNYLAYYGQVQEEPVNLWGVTNALAQSLPIAPEPYASLNPPSIFLRLTTISAPTGETNILNTGDFGTTGQVVGGLALRDCEVYGAGANWLMSETENTPLVGLTNNVFHRVPFAVSNNATIASYNNLFYGTTNTNSFLISIRHRAGASSPNTNENNVFDGVTASLDGMVGYNAYLHGATNINYTNNNDIWTNITWLGGPLGAYYQATNSPLLTNGSTFATNLGLYHYTAGTNEVVEGTNIVSRGYHYVALGTNGLPLDTSGDGVPDYLADVNGNNSGGNGSWTNYISPNGLSTASGLMVFTPLQ